MDTFNIIVGIFSIIGSIFGVISASALISINNKMSVNGNNNQLKNTSQTNIGKNNQNNIS